MPRNTDPIIDEIRRLRDAHAAKFNYDVREIAKDWQRRERESGRKVVYRAPRKPTRRNVKPSE